MHKKGDISILVVFAAVISVMIIITLILTIYTYVDSKKTHIIKEESREYDANHIFMAYLRSIYDGKPISEVLPNLDLTRIPQLESYSRLFFRDVEGYWQIYFVKDGKTIIIDKEGDYLYQMYSPNSLQPDIKIVLPDKNDNKIEIKFYYILSDGGNYYA